MYLASIGEVEMELVEDIRIEAGYGAAMEIQQGEHIRVSCPEGSQVADFWAFDPRDTSIFLSTEHTRSTLEKLVPGTGDVLYSNRRHPMLTIVEDTSPGTHDMLMSACDPRRYEVLGHEGYHRSCAENLCQAMDDAGKTAHELPSPFNIFEHVTVDSDGALAIVPPAVKPGQYLEMHAECDLLVVVSACPMDIARTNGPDGTIRPVQITKFS